MKLLRIFFSILVLLIIVAVFAIGCLVYFVDPNKLKPVIAEEVEKKTGYQLAIFDDLSWSFYPRLSVKIVAMNLIAPKQNTPFATFKDVRVAMDLRQLFHGVEQLNGKVYIGSFDIKNVHAENAKMDLDWNNNVLTLQSIEASFYQGTLKGVIRGSQFGSIPKWYGNLQLTGFQVKPLLLDMKATPRNLSLSGVCDLSLQVTSEGKTREQILNQLNGAANFKLHNGVIEGINLNYFVQAADAIINKQSLPVSTEANQTAFNQVTASAIIKNGHVYTENIVLSSSAFMTKGQGNIDIVDESLNLQMQIAVREAINNEWQVPILIEGELAHPDVRLDANQIGRLIVADEFKKVKSKVNDKVDNFLQNIFQR